MGLDELFSTESAMVAAVTAAVVSPRTRETMRRGAVLGVAGAMRVGDLALGVGRGAVGGVRDVVADGGSVAERSGAKASSASAPVSDGAAPEPAPSSSSRRSRSGSAGVHKRAAA